MARLTLEVSEDVDALLRDLARAEKIDKYEVIRPSVTLGDGLVDCLQHKAKPS